MTISEYSEVLERVERLPLEDQHQLLAELTARVQSYIPQCPNTPLGTPIIGTPGADLMQFVGSIEPSSLRAMEEAIEAECEQVDLRGW